MRTAANPLPANRAKTAPGRAANVRGDNPPPEPAGRILPPKNPPHLTDCRRPFPPPRAAANGRQMHPAAGMHLTNYPPPRTANGGRRMHRAEPARRRRRVRATCPAFLAPRKCTAGGGAGRNRRGMSHRVHRGPPDLAAAKRRGRGEVHGRRLTRGGGRRPAQGRGIWRLPKKSIELSRAFRTVGGQSPANF